MEYTINTECHESSVSVNGRLTYNDHSKLRAMISEMQEAPSKRCVVDLNTLEFIDSAGVGMLLIVFEELSGFDKQLILRGASGQVRRVLTVAQLNKLIAMDD